LSRCWPSNPQTQLTGRSTPSFARALIARGDQRNKGVCGRGHEYPQLMRKSLDGTQGQLANVLSFDDA